RPRSAKLASAHAGCALRARSTAARTSSAVCTSISPISSSVAGLRKRSRRRWPGSTGRLSTTAMLPPAGLDGRESTRPAGMKSIGSASRRGFLPSGRARPCGARRNVRNPEPMTAAPHPFPAAGEGAAGAEPALLRRHPRLRALPRAPFVTAPTPVEPLPLPGAPAGACFVKRDERSCALYGGNKPRKLEWVLGAARARGGRRLVTSGGIGTHHGLATAILGRSLDMATTVVCVPQPVTPHVLEQLDAMLAWGAEIRFARGVPGAAAQTVRALVRARLAGERPLLVPTGGSSALGDVGFVAAAYELADQVAAGALPEPAEIYVPVGSGGTLSGLVLGLALAGLRTRVVGVLVTDILP